MPVKHKLYGAILGDLCGQPYEFPIMQGPYTKVKLHNPDSHFTDDTLMTLATARVMLEDISFDQAYKEMGLKYQGDYYGKGFKEWINSPEGTLNNSFGNGCLMRISPLMYLISNGSSQSKIVESCFNSHAHPISVNSCLRLLDIYQLSYLREIIANDDDKIPPFEKFEVRADKTYEFIFKLYWNVIGTHKAIKKAVECGGDTDTNASIIGELMNYTFDDITRADVKYVESKLDPYLLGILKDFNEKFKNY